MDALLASIRSVCEGLAEIRLMEVCGTHTVSIFRSGIRSLLPKNVRLISGPGCPVCVTPSGYLDAACNLAGRSGVTVCTYGDMVRVPGTDGSLADHRAQGGDVRVVYSVRDALRYAMDTPDKEVVFLAIGFETTAPATASAILEARRSDVKNFSVLEGHKLVVPAMRTLLSDPSTALDGFICPGHVSVVIGSAAYKPISREYGKPCVVAGFEPIQILACVERLAMQVREGRADVENVYQVAVKEEGNVVAMQRIEEVFQPAAATWRAMGSFPDSGLKLRQSYQEFDAARRFGLKTDGDYEPPACRCGDVIQGKVEPLECALFGKTCTTTHPIGPCMVSSEGTCAAWFKYGSVAR
ncbi:hydrogenase formation protein HypD [bacterium]|nr:hydrogenase formation protein HypD [bacterium]